MKLNKLYIGKNLEGRVYEETCSFLGYAKEKLAYQANVFIIDKDKILVEDIAELGVFDSLSCNEETRVCVIPRIDNATVIVQNKLLKLLEDSNISFIMGAESREKVIPTVLSRCRQVEVVNETDSSVLLPFQNLHTREEIFVRLHLKDEKDAESFYVQQKNITDVLIAWRNLFCELCEQVLSDKEVASCYKGLVTLFKISELVCFVKRLDEDMRKPHYTKDDFFMLVASLVK